jgi:glycosyltransferase involved in cell wall biosynthesis
MKNNVSHDNQQIINIAFAYMGGETWTFGNVYLNDLLKTLKKYGPSRYHYFVFIPSSLNAKALDVIPGINFIEFDDYKIETTADPIMFGYTALKSLFLKKIRFNNLLIKHKIDIFFGPLIDYRLSKVKTLSWLPDFQHVHLPDMFSHNEYKNRDRLFQNVAKYSSRVIVLSESAKKDFEKFAPEYLFKVRIFSPICYLERYIYDLSLKNVLLRYDLPEKFIFLPNQFWKHKNHIVVLKAIKILQERGIKIILLCAGNATDYRNPSYFSILNRKISECRIRNQIIYIGLIPREDVLLLMRQSICLINPSLFEGFGFSVDEARSIGKKVILSDIPPHREQNPPKAVYFAPDDVNGLAAIIERIWTETPPGPDLALELSARNDYLARINKNVLSFTNIVEETLRD